jgi:hypothetical protein
MANPRAESIALFAAGLLVAAFVASFAGGFSWNGLTGRSDSSAPTPPPADLAEPRASGKVEVLNAAGVTGIARQATDRLRRGGFDVVFFGNHNGAQVDTSYVIDRTGNPSLARAIADQLGIDSVRAGMDSTVFADATVMLGKNWPPPAVAAEGDWRARLKARIGN